jgi:hypothetical protein
MDANYDRLEMELHNLRARVRELEHSNQDLQRKYYALLTCYNGIQIKDYLDNYKPKK